MPATTATAEFFDMLGRRGPDPLLAKVTGTVRFDVRNGAQPSHWLVAIDQGTITVTRHAGPAQAVITTDAPTLDRLVRGESNGMAALLRGAITVEGDLELLIMLQRIFPSPPGAVADGAEAAHVSAEGRPA